MNINWPKRFHMSKKGLEGLAKRKKFNKDDPAGTLTDPLILKNEDYNNKVTKIKSEHKHYPKVNYLDKYPIERYASIFFIAIILFGIANLSITGFAINNSNNEINSSFILSIIGLIGLAFLFFIRKKQK